MRTVPIELVDLIPIEAHAGVCAVMDECADKLGWNGPPPISAWMLALSLWNARQITEAMNSSGLLRHE